MIKLKVDKNGWLAATNKPLKKVKRSEIVMWGGPRWGFNKEGLAVRTN